LQYYKICTTLVKAKVIKNESKQETLEEAAEIEKIAMDKLKSKWEHLYTFGYPKKPFPTNYENDLNNVKVGLYEGAKWQAERMYSEEEVLELLHKRMSYTLGAEYKKETTLEWFEQFKT
jgi:2-oxo-4-hydroxy-4-carboxy--5-ureidoimidazoline (OHCU) decarboxylase